MMATFLVVSLIQTQAVFAQVPGNDSTAVVTAQQPTQQLPTVKQVTDSIPEITDADTVEMIASKLISWNATVMGFVTIFLGYVFRLFRKSLSEKRKEEIQKWTALIIFLGSSVVLVGRAAIQGSVTPMEIVGIAFMVFTSIGLHTTILKPLERWVKSLFSKEETSAKTA